MFEKLRRQKNINPPNEETSGAMSVEQAELLMGLSSDFDNTVRENYGENAARECANTQQTAADRVDRVIIFPSKYM